MVILLEYINVNTHFHKMCWGIKISTNCVKIVILFSFVELWMKEGKRGHLLGYKETLL